MDWPPTEPPNFDPDLQELPLVSTALESVDVHLAGCVFCNTSGLARTVTLTDTAGIPILNAVDIPESGIDFTREWNLVRLTGVKWSASGAGVKGKPWGWK